MREWNFSKTENANWDLLKFLKITVTTKGLPSNQGIKSSTYKIPAEGLQQQQLGAEQKRLGRQTQSVKNWWGGGEVWKREGGAYTDIERKMGGRRKMWKRGGMWQWWRKICKWGRGLKSQKMIRGDWGRSWERKWEGGVLGRDWSCRQCDRIFLSCEFYGSSACNFLFHVHLFFYSWIKTCILGK